MIRLGWIWTSGPANPETVGTPTAQKHWNLRHNSETGEWTPVIYGPGDGIMGLDDDKWWITRANNYVWDPDLEEWVPSELF